MSDEIAAAEYVLLVFTETYLRRFEGKEVAEHGRGVTWEGRVVTADVYAADPQKVKYIPVVVTSDDQRLISKPFTLTNFYTIGTADNRDIERLLRHLHGMPSLVPAPIGEPPEFDALHPVDRTVHGEREVARISHDQLLERVREWTSVLESGTPSVAARAAVAIGDLYASDLQFVAAAGAYRRAGEISLESGLRIEASDKLSFVLEKMNEHYGEGSAVQAARDYIHSVQDGDMKEIWDNTDPGLRLVLAQAFVWANKEHPTISGMERSKLADTLASLTTHHPIKQDFFATQLNELRSAYSRFDFETWGAAERPRHYGLDYELVIFMETGGEVLVFDDSRQVEGFSLLMRRRGFSWQVASFEAAYSVPGWPPTRSPLPDTGVAFENPSTDGPASEL